MKKKLLLLGACSIVVTSIFLASCKKEEANGLTSSPEMVQGGTSSARLSSTNPYNSLGEQHNRGLDYFLNNADFKQAKASVYPITVEYETSEGYKKADIQAILANSTVSNLINSNNTTALSDYFKANNLTEESKYLEQILSAINTSFTAIEANKKLRDIEVSVSSNTQLSDDNKYAFMAGLAIGRYSINYWYAQSQLGALSPWVIKGNGQGVGTSGGPVEGKINWWKVGAQDLAGGLVGGLFGGGAGAAGGALGASVSEIIGEVM